MNIETEQNTGSSAKDAFGSKGTKLNSISFSHPYAKDIIDRAKELMRESETGSILVSVQEQQGIPIHVLKGDGESGYNALSKVIYVPVSGKKDKLDGRAFILFVKAFRALDQEFAGLETPDPSMEVIKYAGRLHAKNVDSIFHACKVVSEMQSSKVFSNLLDAMNSFGYSDLYRAYEKNVSKEDFYKIYSEG